MEMLRRKFAHTPRPLKKRSSITEAERAQGPNFPKLLYDKMYKQADIPFHPLSGIKQPPPAYKEPINKVPDVTTVDEAPPADNISFESNVTPTQYLKQLNQNQRYIL